MNEGPPQTQAPETPRSRFVTAVARVFVVLACLGLLGSTERFAVALGWSGGTKLARSLMTWGVPFLLWDLLDEWALLVWPAMAFFGAALTASVGLLKRSEWARKLLLVLLPVAAAALGFLALAHLFSLAYVLTFLQAEVPWARCDEVTAVKGMGALVISTAGCLALIWVLWRLTLPTYKREFETDPATDALWPVDRP